jgi:4-aminobutyrate aminotransferase
MSKAVAAGLPLGICAAKNNVMDWDEGAHENTLGGNPIIMSAAKAVLNIIKKENLCENSQKIGDYLRKRFIEMSNDIELMGDIRGKGLMIGIELVTDRKTKQPAVKERDRLINETFKRGLLLLGAGQSSIRLAPPLILSKEQADMGLEIFEESIKHISRSYT